MLHKTFLKILSLLTPWERRRFLLLFVCILLSAILDMAGVASIMPFMAVVSRPELFGKHHLFNSISAFWGLHDAGSFVVFLGTVVLILLIAGNLFAAFSTAFLIRTGALLNHSLSRRLFAAYLFRPYESFLREDSSRLNRNIMVEVYNAVFWVVNPTLLGIARLISAGALILLLFWINPLTSLAVALVLCVLYPAIYLPVRKIMKWNGQRHQILNRELAKIIAEAFGGIKEIKLSGLEREFPARFQVPSRQVARHHTIGSVVPLIPRYLMETVAFGGLIIIIICLVRSGRDISSVLPLITLYALAGYRLLPAFQQAFAGFAQARFHLPSLDMLLNDLAGVSPLTLDNSKQVKPEPLHFTGEIRIEEVSFRYEGSVEPALKGLSITIPACSTTALVGSSGSGKTTAVDILLGLLSLQEGRILIDGLPLTEENLPAWQRNLGYVPQVIFLTDDTISCNIAFGLPDSSIDHAAVERAAKGANIHDFIVNLPAGYKTIVGERGVRLSGGERQRIGIARALYHDPPVLVLDEATSSLDGITEDAILMSIRTLAGKKTIIMIAHRITTVMDCDTIFLMENGRIVSQGTYRELIDTNMQFRKMAKHKVFG